MSDFYMGEDEFGKGGCRRGGQQGAYMRHEFSSLCTALNIKGQVLIDVYAERNEFTPRDARKLAPDEVYFVTRYWEQQIRVKGGDLVREFLCKEMSTIKKASEGINDGMRHADSCRSCGFYAFDEGRRSGYCDKRCEKTRIYLVCDDYKRADPPNYRNTGGSPFKCSNCRSRKGGTCPVFLIPIRPRRVCDRHE